jgi:hypothetical protein
MHSLFILALMNQALIPSHPPYAQQHLSIEKRNKDNQTIESKESGWLIYQKLRYTGPDLVVKTKDVTIELAGRLYNSRAPQHTVVRPSLLLLKGFSSNSSKIITDNVHNYNNCTEYGQFEIWVNADQYERQEQLHLTDGCAINYIIRESHNDTFYGQWYPLLGKRTIKLTLGQIVFCAKIDIDKEQYTERSNKIDLTKIPEEFIAKPHLSTQFNPPPYTLHLSNNKYSQDSTSSSPWIYRTPELNTRGGAKCRLKFDLMIADNSTGTVFCRVNQYRDGISTWQVMSSNEYSFEIKNHSFEKWYKNIYHVDIKDDTNKVVIEFKVTQKDVDKPCEVYIANIDWREKCISP